MTDTVNASLIDPARLIDFAAAVYAGEGVPEDTRADLERIARATGLEAKLPL